MSYPCSHCNFTAPLAGRLRPHFKYNHEWESKRYPWDTCEHTATTPIALKINIESKHEGLRYLCNKCKYTAPRGYDLKQHIIRMLEGVRYPCDDCKHISSTRSNLKIYVDLVDISLLHVYSQYVLWYDVDWLKNTYIYHRDPTCLFLICSLR